MAAKRDDHEARITDLEFTMHKVVLPWKEKTDAYLEKSRGGIDFATLLDNRATTAIILAILGGAGLYIISKGGL